MTDDFEFDPIAQELRASLERHAREAPRADLLAERIIQTSDRSASKRSRRPGWRTWSLPLIAAGAVAGVVAAVVGIENFHSNASGPQQPGSSNSGSVQNSAPVTTHTSVGTSRTAPVPPVDTSTLHGVTVLDLTFVSENEGWALASADCTSGAGRCSALFHVNGGKWGSLPNSTPFNVTGVTGGCGYPCVTNIRFANPQVGYAFGPEAFLMTLDGGHHWARQDGGAIALESLDGNVIRVTASSASGCPGPCNVAVETSSIGSTKWTRADLPSVSGTGISFSRGQPSNAYLLVTRSPAGGAADATSTLYRSTDDGASWQALGEPCPQTGGEVDSFAVSGSGTNRVSALCVSRQALQRIVVATSTDGGAHFVAQPGRIQPKSSGVLTGDPATVLVIAGETGLLRSGDGGRTWQHVAGVTGSIGFVGFESSTVGRAVSTDGTTIWTTRDAGETWQPVTFG